MKRLLLVLLVSSNLTYAQNFWTALNGPYGAATSDMVVHPSGPIVIGTYGGGVWRSTDEGATWTKAVVGTDNYFYDLDVDPSGNLYALNNLYGSPGIYKSTDAGVSWTKLTGTGLPTDGSALTRISAASSSRIYVFASNHNIYRSNNGGANFALSSSDISVDINVLATSPLNPDYVYAATSGQGVKVSEDGGFNFNTLTISGSLTSVVSVNSLVFGANGVAYAVSNSGLHMKSITSGSNNWTSINGNITDGIFLGKLGIDASSQNLYCANVDGNKIWTTAISGIPNSWTSTPYPSYQFTSAIYPISSTKWIMTGYYSGPYVTTNSGGSWSLSAGTMTALNIRNTYVTDQNRYFATYDGFGYFQSIDQGETWTQQSASPADRQFNSFVKTNAGTLGASYGGNVQSTGTIGNSWTTIGPQSGNYALPKVAPDGTLWAPYGQTIYKSTDNGSTWINLAITGLNGNDIAKLLADKDGNVLVVTYGTELFKIPSGSTTAQHIDLNVTDFSVSTSSTASHSFVAYLVNTNILVYSTDGFITFNSMVIPSTYRASNIWALRNGVVVTRSNSNSSQLNVTNDYGNTWTTQQLPDPSIIINDITIFDNERLMVATSNGVVYVSTNTVALPAAPSNLTYTSLRTNAVTLRWEDNSDNEASFLLQQSMGDNTSYQDAGTDYINFDASGYSRNDRNVPMSGLQPGTVYYFRIFAQNGAGKSAATNELMITTPTCTIPSAVPDNRSWTATVTADVGYSGQGGATTITSNNELLQNVNGNLYFNYDFGILPPRDGINFIDECGIISAVDGNDDTGDQGNGNGTWDAGSKTLTVKWQTGPVRDAFKATTTFVLNSTDPIPSTPQLNAYVYSPTEILLNWNVVGFEKQYKIKRSTTPGGPYTLTGTVDYPNTNYIDKSLATGTTYYYVITSANDAGESPNSTQTSVTPAQTLFRPVENSIQLNYENQQGMSWGDLDGDGDEDLASPSFVDAKNNGVPPRFYENNGSGQFTLRNVDVIAGETHDISRGVAIFDMDNDGKLDMYVDKNGPVDPEYILMNHGSWNFTKTDVPQSGLDASTFRSMGLLDYNKDGYVDLFLAADFDATGPGVNPVLLKNDKGTNLVPVTVTGLTDALLNARTMSIFDYDNDGDEDVYSGNFNEANTLFRNNNDGTFTKMTGLIFDSEPGTPRSISTGDIDNDGDLDIYVGFQSNVTADQLYKNNGNGTFTLSSGVVAESTLTYGSAFGDIDNDGDLDLMVVNSTDNSIFINDGTGSFSKYNTVQELIIHPNIFDIGGAFGDYDQDGFLDFIAGKGSTTTVNLPNLLYQNIIAHTANRNWLEIKLVGTVSNKSAIGARVKVITATPSRTQIREVQSLTGYGSQNSLVQHFGLGSATSVSSIEVRWPNGKVQTFPGVASKQIITLVEDATPPLLTFTPANAATGLKLRPSITVTTDETSTAVAGKLISIYASSDLTTPAATIDVSTGIHVSNTFTYTLSADLVPNTQYKLSIDAGAYSDGSNNLTTALAQGDWSFTTSNGPNITTMLPANSATGILNTTNIEITFDGPVTAVTGKKLTVKDGETVVYDINVGTTGSVTDNKYVLSGQAGLPFEKQLNVTVDAGAFLDADGVPFKGIVAGDWKFTTAAQVDDTAPTVTFDATTLALLEKNFTDITASITATDNVDVATVVFNHRKISDAAWQTTNATLTTGNQYSVTVSKSFADAMGFEFFITATDGKGNIGRLPAGENATFVSRLKMTEAGNVPTLTFPTAGTQQSWSIIAVPYELTVIQVQQLLSAQGESSKTTWRLLTYSLGSDGKDSWLAYPTIVNFERGTGYFINSKLTGDKSVVSFANASAPNYTRTNLFKMNFKKGWNQIGNPYLINLDWNDIITFNNASSTLSKLQLYANGQYVEEAQLVAGVGGFVFAQSDVTNVSFSFPGQSPSRMEEVVFGDLNSNNWKVDFTLSQGEMTSKSGGVGMHEVALDEYDPLDGFNPPRFFDYLETNFSHPEHFYGYFAKDIIKPRTEHIWEFEVDSNINGIATLSWDNSGFGTGTRELYLYDIETQTPVDMRGQSFYSFDPIKSSRFRIYYGDNAFGQIKAERVILGDAYPNPAQTIASIPFSLPDKTSTFGIRLEVFDMLGRKVTTLLQRDLAPGFYKADWHVAESTDPVNNSDGIYIYRLTVDSGGSTEILSGKLMLKK